MTSNPLRLVAAANIVALLALMSNGQTKKKLGESCALTEDCVMESNCTTTSGQNKVCACNSSFTALHDGSGCVSVNLNDLTTRACTNNNDCQLVFGAGPCVVTNGDHYGNPFKNSTGHCNCAQDNRIAPNKSFCLTACDKNSDCNTTRIKAAFLSWKHNISGSSNVTDSPGPCARTPDSFKYCDFGFKLRFPPNTDVDSIDATGSNALTMWLLITIVSVSLGIVATVVIVVLVVRGRFSGDPGAALGRTKGIPQVRRRLRMAPLPYGPVPVTYPMYPPPVVLAQRPSFGSVRGRQMSNASLGRRMPMPMPVPVPVPLSRSASELSRSQSYSSVGSRRMSTGVDSSSVVSSSIGGSDYSGAESSTMVSGATSSVYSQR